MPTEYLFRKVPVPRTGKHKTEWCVKELRDGKPFGTWKRLYMTPRGAYYLLDSDGKRHAYMGAAPTE